MKNSKSVVFKRQQYILKSLKENGRIKVDDIATKLQVSPTTVRRDLILFEKKNLIERFHGGAKLLDVNLKEDPSQAMLPPLKIQQKHAIAKHAASLVVDGDSIFINSSSTALLMLKYLKGKRVIVITNNGKALYMDKDPQVELVLTGGEVYERKQSMVGDFAMHTLSKITASKAFIGVGGISADGVTTSVLQETAINDIMLRRSKGSRYVLAISTKIGREHNFMSSAIGQVSCLITNPGGNQAEIDRLHECGVDVVEVDVSETPGE